MVATPRPRKLSVSEARAKTPNKASASAEHVSAARCTKQQRDCLAVLFGIYADRSLSPQQSGVVLSLSSVGWRKFARDLLRLDDGKHLVLPMEQLCAIFQTLETAAPQQEPKATWTVGGIPPLKSKSGQGTADICAFVRVLNEIAYRWRPHAAPSPLAALLHAVGTCAFRQPELERLENRVELLGVQRARVVGVLVFQLAEVRLVARRAQ